MATAVDIISYLNPTSDTKTSKQTNDSPDDFEKVFSSVNKTYNDDSSSKSNHSDIKNTASDDSNNPKQKINDNQKYSTDDNQKVDNKKNDKQENIQTKQDEKQSQEKNDLKDSGTTNQKTNEKESDTNQEPIAQNATTQDNSKITEEVNTQVNTQVNQPVETILNTPVTNVLPENIEQNSKTEITKEQSSQMQNLTQAQEINKNNSQANQTNNQTPADNKSEKFATNKNTNQPIQQNNIQEQTPVQTQVQVQPQVQVQEKTQSPQQVQAQNASQNQTEIASVPTQKTNINQIGENNQQIQPAQSDTKDLIQQATIQETALTKGQTVDLIKASTIKELAQPQEQNQQATSLIQEVSQDVPKTAEMPVIETNIATKTITQNNSDNNLKDITDKTSLTQEIIDKINAKVVNVESSDSKSSNSDLLSKQSPQEQLVKLSLNNDSNTADTQNSSLTDIANTNIQVPFDKTLNNIQNQPPKELSKTDILSQIHNQLDKFDHNGEETTKVTIVLKPENLGKINLELVNTKDGLTAKMTTDNAQVKELLDKNLNGLKDTIGSQGVNVSNVSVKLENTQSQSNNEFAYEEHQDKGNQQQSNNPQNKDEKESQFANEMNNKMKTENEDEETSYNSEVNYKV